MQLYIARDEMRASCFWNLVPECPREELQEMSHLEKLLMSFTCYCGGSGGLECELLQLCPRKAALLGFMNVETIDERHMGMIER